MTTWLRHVEKWHNCQQCALAQQRSQTCIARSEWPQGQDRPNLRLPCHVLLVGEAPGMSEDVGGYPFVGPAGDLLNSIIDRAFAPWSAPGKEPVTFAMTNLVLCFPRQAKESGENEPERGEILECRSRLVEFVNLARPRMIVRLGKLCRQYLNFDTTVPYCDVDHPAYIVRMKAAQKASNAQRCAVIMRNAWQDVLQSPKRPWKQWGADHAEGTTSYRQHLRQVYGGATHGGEDDIPF